MPTRASHAIPVASRISGFSYAIRNIVAEAQTVEARGIRVRYLNIGDPVAFGFRTPPHLVEAAERAMHDSRGRSRVSRIGHLWRRRRYPELHVLCGPGPPFHTVQVKSSESALLRNFCS